MVSLSLVVCIRLTLLVERGPYQIVGRIQSQIVGRIQSQIVVKTQGQIVVKTQSHSSSIQSGRRWREVR